MAEMDCKEARKLMDSYIDGTISRKDAFRFIAHARSCAECHRELETAFLVANAQKILDDDARDSFDIERIVDTDLTRHERRMRRGIVLNILFWALIVFIALVIVVLCIFAVAPETLLAIWREVANFFQIDPDWQFWKDYAFVW